MENAQDSVQNYNVSLAVDPKVLQWFANQGNDNFILSVYFSTFNYPPDDPQAIARCKQIVTNSGGGIKTSQRFPGQNVTGHFSSSLTFVAEAQESSCIFGSISPNTSNIAFQLRTSSPAGLQIGFMVCVGLDAFAPHRVPTTAPYANSLILAKNGEANGYQGTGTLFNCPIPVTGFKGTIQRQ